MEKKPEKVEKEEEEKEPEKEQEEERESEKEEEREPEKIFRQFRAISFGFTSPPAAPPAVINVAFFTGLAVCLWSLLQRVHTAQREVQVCRILKF